MSAECLNHYKQIFEYAYPIDDINSEKKVLGDKNQRICIFCGKTSPVVSFKKDAHVLPAALGNKRLFNYCECDICNEYLFSVYENELVNLLQIDRIWIRGRPRKGYPKFKHAKSESYMTSIPGTNKVSIHSMESENEYEIEDLGDNIIKFKINKPLSYSLALICKALAHMAWSVLPEYQRSKYPYIQKWLQKELIILPLYLDKAFIQGYGMANVILEVWESSSDQTLDYPLVIRFTYGFSILTFYIPKDINIKCEPIQFTYLKNIPDIGMIDGKRWTIKKEERIMPDNIEYTIRYTSKL
jgi:hypothetical protein